MFLYSSNEQSENETMKIPFTITSKTTIRHKLNKSVRLN